MLGQRPPWTDLWSCDLWCILRETAPSLVNRITDTYKNITLPQLQNFKRKIGKEKTAIENEINCLIKTVIPLKAVIIITKCIPVGCVPPACCLYLPGCTAPGGLHLVRGVYLALGECTWPWGRYLVRGGVPGPMGGTCPGTCPLPLWTEFLTQAYENITLPKTSFAGGNNHIRNGTV